MKRLIKTFFLSSFFLLLLSACSTGSLQMDRMDTAEAYITQAEQALGKGQMMIADDKLGIATAYLATVADHKKFLSKAELDRYNQLTSRIQRLTKRIR